MEASGTGDANVELVRRAFDAWNRDDWEAELGRIYHPEIEAVAPPGFPEGGTYHGWDALRRRYQDLKAEWNPEEIEVHDLQARGNRVAARVIWKGTGRQSGVAISLEVTTIAAIDDGLITHLEYHWDHDSAMRAMRAFEAERSTDAPVSEDGASAEQG